jgi:hypothetical protein
VSRSRTSAADRVGGADGGVLGMAPGIRFAAGIRLGSPSGVEPAEVGTSAALHLQPGADREQAAA